MGDEQDAVSDGRWLQNDMYNLKETDQNNVISDTAWFNDRLMYAAQKMICKVLGLEYQSVSKTDRVPILPRDS